MIFSVLLLPQRAQIARTFFPGARCRRTSVTASQSLHWNSNNGIKASLKNSMLLEKREHMPIERRRIFQAAGVPGAGNGAVFGAGYSRAHILAALKRVIEFTVHDQHRH